MNIQHIDESQVHVYSNDEISLELLMENHPKKRSHFCEQREEIPPLYTHVHGQWVYDFVNVDHYSNFTSGNEIKQVSDPSIQLHAVSLSNMYEELYRPQYYFWAIIVIVIH
eukprot:UN32064